MSSRNRKIRDHLSENRKIRDHLSETNHYSVDNRAPGMPQAVINWLKRTMSCTDDLHDNVTKPETKSSPK
jgi:hypothetical protein